MSARRPLGFVAVAALVALGASLATAPPALGATTTGSRKVTLAADFRNHSDKVVRSVPGLSLKFSVGSELLPAYFFGQLNAKSTTRSNILQRARISCVAPDGAVSYMLADRNNEGSDAYGGSSLKVPVRFLYRPKVAGTHQCRLQIQSLSSAGSQLVLVVLHGSDSYLAYAMPKPRAMSFGTENDRHDSDFATTCPGGAACTNATHLGINHSGVVLPAGTNQPVNRSPIFAASSSAQGADVINDVQVSVCYANTSTCPSYADGGLSIRTAGSTIEVRQVITLLDTRLRACSIIRGTYVRYTITSDAHHQKIYLRTSNLTFNPTCTRKFRTHADVRWISGNPIRIDPPAYETTGIIMQR
jgi:hypothetical protein